MPDSHIYEEVYLAMAAVIEGKQEGIASPVR